MSGPQEGRRRVEACWRGLLQALSSETGLRPRGPAWGALVAGLAIGLTLGLRRPRETDRSGRGRYPRCERRNPAPVSR